MEGKNAGLRSKHLWVERIRGKPTQCENCGKKYDKPRSVQWANIDHKYRRSPQEYMQLCFKCHWEYDKNNGLR